MRELVWLNFKYIEFTYVIVLYMKLTLSYVAAMLSFRIMLIGFHFMRG